MIDNKNNKVLKSTSHLDKFTGIYDMNGVEICNGDKIQVHDNNYYKKDPVIGVVIWKDGNYQFKGNHWCNYNINAWRYSIEVLESNRESIYESLNLEELLEKWEQKNLSFMTTDRKLIRQAFRDAYKLAIENVNYLTTQ